MTIRIDDRDFEIPNDWLQRMQQTLQISVSEAVDMWLDDNDIVTNETAEELTRKVKDSGVLRTIHGASAGKSEKARKPRTKKADETKATVIQILAAAVEKVAESVEIRNSEKYIDLRINGESYMINLIKHRPTK